MTEARASISFKDKYMLDGARTAAKEQGISLSEYITELVGADLNARLGFRMVAHYDNGETHEEADFYSYSDLMESVTAYDTILKTGEPLQYGSTLKGFEVYQHDKLLQKEGNEG